MQSRFCDVGGTMRAERIRPSLSRLITVEQQAAGRLGCPVADAGPPWDGDRWWVGRLVGLYEPQRLLAGVNKLDRTHGDRLERVVADHAQARGHCRLACERGELVIVQRVARERTGEVHVPSSKTRVECVRPSDVILHHQIGDAFDIDVKALGSSTTRPDSIA